MIWSSDQSDPPHYTTVANGIIEQLLNDGYFVSAYWSAINIEGKEVIIDVSVRHKICPEFPGSTVGWIVCGPAPTVVTITGRNSGKSLCIDAADPKSFQKLRRFVKTASR